MNRNAMSAPAPPPGIAALQARADTLLRSGDVTAAIIAHQTLLEQAPDRADAWYNLGYLQRTARDFAGALASYDMALARNATGAEAIHVNRAVILAEHLARPADGDAALRLAVAVNPDFLPAWLNTGQFAEDRGDAAGARLAYGEVLRLDPSNGRAHARLAALDVVDGNAAVATQRLRDVLDRQAPPPHDAVEIGFALGNALDAAGDYRAAFAAIERANGSARRLIPPAARYDRAAHDRMIDAIIATFDGTEPAALNMQDAAPIFICGMFRSGSTLCERLLAQHSRITAGGELEAIPALVAGPLAPYPASLKTADIADLRASYGREVRASFPHADILTDKRCDNVLHIGLIKAMFPDARIIHTRRHAIDNILSVWFLYFGDAAAYGFDLGDIVHYHQGYRRLMAHWQNRYGSDVIDFDYDEAVRDPAGAMQDLLSACGLAPEAACLTGKPAEGVVRTPSAWAVRAPVHARSSGRWHHYRDLLPSFVTALDSP
jgi:Tfp pilus assembly protein PilF